MARNDSEIGSSGSQGRPEVQVKNDHHYLPACYLSGFSDTDGKVWEFNRKYPKYRRRTPRSTAFRKSLYAISDREGNQLNDVEDSFANHENELPRIRSLIEAEHPIDPETWVRLLEFSAAMFVRVESTVGAMGLLGKASSLDYVAENLADEAQTRKTLAAKWGDSARVERIPSAEIDKLVKLVVEHSHSNNLTMDLMQRKRSEAEELLSGKNLAVYFAPPSEFFITTDRPFLPVRVDLTTPGLRGAMGPGTRCLLPFSKRVMLVFHDEPGPKVGKVEMSREELHFLNSRIAHFSCRLIFATAQQQLRSIVEQGDLAGRDPEPTFLPGVE